MLAQAVAFSVDVSTRKNVSYRLSVDVKKPISTVRPAYVSGSAAVNRVQFAVTVWFVSWTRVAAAAPPTSET